MPHQYKLPVKPLVTILGRAQPLLGIVAKLLLSAVSYYCAAAAACYGFLWVQMQWELLFGVVKNEQGLRNWYATQAAWFPFIGLPYLAVHLLVLVVLFAGYSRFRQLSWLGVFSATIYSAGVSGLLAVLLTWGIGDARNVLPLFLFQFIWVILVPCVGTITAFNHVQRRFQRRTALRTKDS